MKRAVYVLLIAALASPAALSQETGKKKITSDSFKLPQWGSYRLSPDNTKIAFTKRDRDEEGELTTSHIFVYDIATGTKRSVRTVGAKLKRLRDLGYTSRSRARGGDAITDAGKERLQQIRGQSSAD